MVLPYRVSVTGEKETAMTDDDNCEMREMLTAIIYSVTSFIDVVLFSILLQLL